MLEWGVAWEALPGQSESGDRYVVEEYGNGILLGALDGLGHGAAAAEAANIAVDTLRRNVGESVLSLVQQCHEALRGTRGVVMTLTALNARDATLTAIGVGNVEGRLVHAFPQATSVASESLMLRGGVIGQNLPSLRAEVIPVTRGDTLILATDGIHSDFAQAVNLAHKPQQIAEAILASQKKGTDDALVLVARFLGNAE